MRARKTKKQVISEFRTNEILEAARRVFAEKGYYAAKVESIAEAAGVSKGTIYLYYPSKSEIYLSALRHGVQAFHKKIQDELDNLDSVEEKIRKFIKVKFTFFHENRDFFKIYFSEFGNAFSHPLVSQKELRDLYRVQVRFLERILDQGLKAKTFRKIDTEAVASAIADLTRCVITRSVMTSSKKLKIEEDTQFVFDLIWKGISR
jgi:AcrR family transcriptional regulator